MKIEDLGWEGIVTFDPEFLNSFHLISLDDIPRELEEKYFRNFYYVNDNFDSEEGEEYFVGTSRNVCGQAIQAGYEPLIVVIPNDVELKELLDTILASYPETPVCILDRENVTRVWLDEDVKQDYFNRIGPICLFRKRPIPTVEEAVSQAENVLVLQNIQLSHPQIAFVGTTIRHGIALFADAVLYGPEMLPPYHKQLLRYCSGTVLRFPFSVYQDGEEVAEILRKEGFTLVQMCACQGEGILPVDDPVFVDKKIALFIDGGFTGGKEDPICDYDYEVYIPRLDEEEPPKDMILGLAFWKLAQNTHPLVLREEEEALGEGEEALEEGEEALEEVEEGTLEEVAESALEEGEEALEEGKESTLEEGKESALEEVERNALEEVEGNALEGAAENALEEGDSLEQVLKDQDPSQNQSEKDCQDS